MSMAPSPAPVPCVNDRPRAGLVQFDQAPGSPTHIGAAQ